jgi:hypothetical protein
VPSIPDVARLLVQYKGRFDTLDAFADDIAEVRKHTLPGTLLRSDPHPLLAVPVGSTTTLLVELFPADGVVRFKLPPQPVETQEDRTLGTTAILHGLLGTAIGVATNKKEGLLGGLILGMLLGSAAVGAAAKPVESVLAFQFDPATAGWRLYNGALLRWAKLTLQPTAA